MMNRIYIAVVCMTTLMLSGCAFNNTGGGNTAPPNTGVNTFKKQVARAWHVGSFTVSTQLLPRFYNPNRSPHFVVLEPSALYYVPESTPTEVVAQSLSNGQTKVVASVDCVANWQGLPIEVHSAGYSYLLVQCGSPSGKLQGILVDATTGTTWTLWTNGQAGSDGTLDGEAVVSAGWVYFETSTTKFGPVNVKSAMELATGLTKPVPFPLNAAQAWDTLLAPDGTLYATWGGYKGQDLTSVDLYRVTGLNTTLVAHLPGGAGFAGPLSIGANGTIWVTKPGGTLTPNAGSMTIRVWDPTHPPVPPKSEVLLAGTGYVAFLGPPPSPGAEGPVQVTLATSGEAKTIVVGKANVSSIYMQPDGPLVGVIFRAPHGRWQVLTVSGG